MVGQVPKSLSFGGRIVVDLEEGQFDTVIHVSEKTFWGDGIATSAPFLVERLT
jgi:hypothetical protein